MFARNFERVSPQNAEVASVVIAAKKLRPVLPGRRVERDRSEPGLEAVLVPSIKAAADDGVFAVNKPGLSA